MIPRWLIVEDVDHDLELLLRELEPFGARFITAQSIAQAKRRLEFGDYQIAFINLDLPDNPNRGPDLGLVHWIRAKWPALPIIVVSGHSDPKVRNAALAAGAVYFFDKTFDRASNPQIANLLEQLTRAEERGKVPPRNWRTTSCSIVCIIAGALVAADFGPLVTKIAGCLASSFSGIGLLFSADAKNLNAHLTAQHDRD